MNVIAVNGSPRKNWNTAALLEKAAEGASSNGASAELVNLYELSYKGCRACLECKRKNSKGFGRCAVKDGLSEVLEKIDSCGALILGSPIYFGEVTGMMRSFLERLLFPYLSYDKDGKPSTPRVIPNAFIYTMNVPESVLVSSGYAGRFSAYAALLERVLGPSHSLCVTETLQVDDYSKYHMTMFNEEERRERRGKIFPLDCEKARELGARLVEKI
jgi:multimeric flavodoxin WrbA